MSLRSARLLRPVSCVSAALGLLLAVAGCRLQQKRTQQAPAFPTLDTWQGTAQIELVSGGHPGTVTLAKRGDVYRFEAPQHAEVFGSYGGEAGPRRFLFDAKAHTLTLVVDAAKQALDYDLTVLDGMAQNGAAAPFELTDSGRHDTVAGHACDVWTGGAASTKVEACMVKQSAKSLALGQAFLPPDAAWAKPLLDGEHVPLSVVVKDGDAITWSARFTSIDTTAPSGDFDVPAGYQRDNFIDALKRVRASQGR